MMQQAAMTVTYFLGRLGDMEEEACCGKKRKPTITQVYMTIRWAMTTLCPIVIPPLLLIDCLCLAHFSACFEWRRRKKQSSSNNNNNDNDNNNDNSNNNYYSYYYHDDNNSNITNYNNNYSPNTSYNNNITTPITTTVQQQVLSEQEQGQQNEDKIEIRTEWGKKGKNTEQETPKLRTNHFTDRRVETAAPK